GAATRPSRNMVEIPRIAGGREAVPRHLETERELVGDELAKKHGAGLAPARHAGGIVLWNPVGIQSGPSRRPDPAREVDVLVGDRYAQKRARVALAKRFFGGPRVGQRAVRGQGDEGVQDRVALL